MLGFAAVMLIVVLFESSHRAIHKYNTFMRQFPPHPIAPVDTLDIGYDSYYLAGSTRECLYLGNTTSPLHLLVVSHSLKERQDVTLWSEEIGATKFWALRIKIDSPYFFLADGAVPRTFVGRIDEWVPRRYEYDSAYFVDFEPVSYGTLAIRSVSSATNQFVLGSQSIQVPHVRLATDLLQKQIDGRFCVDGMLHYNKTLDKLIYLYYYRNQFLVYDTGLNLSYRGNTIDTVSRAKIKIASITSTGSITHAAPPLIVNKHSYTGGNFLFVNSALMAKNETLAAFSRNSVIDVYNVLNGQYKFSFYIPTFDGKSMHDFSIVGNRLIVLVDKYMVSYELAAEYFEMDN